MRLNKVEDLFLEYTSNKKKLKKVNSYILPVNRALTEINMNTQIKKKIIERKHGICTME